MASIKSVEIEGLTIGGGAPVRVESMLKTRLTEPEACIKETERLKKLGCELVRAALQDADLSANFKKLVQGATIPVMADIHFDHRLALAALDAGCRAIRINPGNISSAEGVTEVANAARGLGAVIRIGANGGSLNIRQLEKANGDRGAALAAAVEEQLALLTSRGFDNIILSAKSSSIDETVRANFILSQRWPYPLHIGITEAGCGNSGIVKGAAGISLMLAQGIGDTIRVSLTDDCAEEIETGYNILSALGLRTRGWELISCPTCGRRRIEVSELVKRLRMIIPPTAHKGMKIAVMGCEVNGPKEASHADFGIAGSPEGFIVFKKGAFVCRGEMADFENIIRRELKMQ